VERLRLFDFKILGVVSKLRLAVKTGFHPVKRTTKTFCEPLLTVAERGASWFGRTL